MKQNPFHQKILQIPAIVKLTLLGGLAAIALAGCQSAVDVQGSYGADGKIITGSVDLNTNGITVGGNYQAGATNLSGSINVSK